ncbi:ribokinase [Aggregatibacter actinomycetemcomitans]|uniref:ribokinase n=1 Tax=Aggregatibacter actinomycetemcomitans TaxID=714 RepID=UPI00197B9556|nr:ribokinase [Aggregatibacter actinomycetemcomitans]MBN6081149.1 ribokinase [Aggregatibacter actinomycetemcomitans]
MCAKLVVLGSVNADHVIRVPRFARAGETLRGAGYRIAYGGKGANQAVAAARLKDQNTQVDFIACIGNDDIGHAMKSAFARDGINTATMSQIEQEMTGIAMIQVADSGENSIVISAGANACLDEHIVSRYAAHIQQADALLMQLETPLSAICLAAQIAQQQGTKVILNPAPAQALPEELFHRLYMITPNETEAEILTGIKVEDEISAAQAAEKLHRLGVQIVLITLGAKGVYISENRQGQIIGGFRVKAKDTTAAGDTFNGALVVALLEGKTLTDAIRFAHAAAAIGVTREGAQPSIPNRAETLDFLAQQP